MSGYLYTHKNADNGSLFVLVHRSYFTFGATNGAKSQEKKENLEHLPTINTFHHQFQVFELNTE